MIFVRTFLIIPLILLVFSFNTLDAQVKGEEPPEPRGFDPDTLTFESPRPLISNLSKREELSNAWGVDLIFSDNGFGAGMFLQYYFSDDMLAFGGFYISEARNRDEFEYFDPLRNEYRVPNKINRIYMFPLTFGVQKYLFQDVIFETLRPFISLGAGPTTIMTTPYEEEFFSAFGSANFYGRFSGFVGIGADVGSYGQTLMAVNLRYYYIPFGGKGIESIIDDPIKDLGGIFLSLSIGGRY